MAAEHGGEAPPPRALRRRPFATGARGPLHGVRVLDLSRVVAGNMVSLALADFGAEVIKVETPEGDALRDWLVAGVPTNWKVYARNKKSLCLNLRRPEAIEALLALVEGAQVLIENFRPGTLEKMGLGPEALHARNPKLVLVRVTGWGQDGPLARAAGHDINYIALTGALHATGRAGQPPSVPLNLLGDYAGGSLYLAFGLLAGIIEARGSGKGQVVDAAIVDGATSLMSFFFGVRGRPFITTERGRGMLGGAAHFYRCFTCADGKEISLGAIEPQFYAEMLAKAGAPSELAQGQMNPANWDDYAAKLAALFLTKTQAEWCALLEGSDACFAPVLALDEAREHPHMKARGAYVEHEGEWHTAPAPRFSRTPGAVRSSADDGADVVARWKAQAQAAS